MSAPLAKHAAPLVSVVVPTYNRLEFLRAAIDSVLNQTFRDIEVIVQDNASIEDPTPLIAALADPRVRIYRNATNIGQTPNIVTACGRAVGKYIAILGDDDLWQPDFLAKLVPPLEQDAQIVVSFCDHDVIDQRGQLDVARTAACTRRFRQGLSEGVYGPFVDLALVRRSICVVSAAVFRSDALDWQAVPKNMPYMSDVYVNYLGARTGKRCYYHPARLAQRRHLDESASVEATATVQTTETIARTALACWDTLFRDSAVADGRRYFAMKRADNAIRILWCGLAMRRWGAVLREFAAFWQSGVVGPRVLLYHFRYGLH